MVGLKKKIKTVKSFVRALTKKADCNLNHCSLQIKENRVKQFRILKLNAIFYFVSFNTLDNVLRTD